MPPGFQTCQEAKTDQIDPGDPTISRKGEMTMMFGGGMMYGYGGMLIGLLFNMAILVGIVLLVVWAVKQFTGGGLFRGTGAQTPREILQARYARGEITREQYQQMLQDVG
jgi:putative membrane protein